MVALSIIFLLTYLIGYALVFHRTVNGDLVGILLYTIVFLPVYTVFLCVVYNGIREPYLIAALQYSKEILFFLTFGIIIFGRKRLLTKSWDLSRLDLSILLFMALAFAYVLLPIGEASFLNKAIYFKNISLIGLFYLFGRQMQISRSALHLIFKAIFGLAIVAAVVVVVENLANTHLHSLIGYWQYNYDIKEIELHGVFGIGYTFEAQGGQPRYGSFFSNPLEFSASMLVVVAGALIFLLSVRYNTNRLYYLGVLTAAFVCLLYAYSRATFVAFFFMLIFIAFMLKYYKILSAVMLVGLAIILYISFFAPRETLYFVLDTLTFQNSSSITHLIDWAQGVQSIIENPMGIGLATSGNTSGVEDELRVGGENQYLIYGVQLGIFGMILYGYILFLAIKHAWKAFRMSSKREEAVIPFVAASVKFGMLLPLFTANVEAYLFISLFSWWLVGQSESQYRQLMVCRYSTKPTSI
jgi:hypothetical protein